MLKLGVIGLSEGNGHPYSWSAIFNGYNQDAMENCGFPVIPRYLEQQKWPESRIIGAEVVSVWTQDRELSEKISRASSIKTVVKRPDDMLGQVNALLLARDDAENHLEYAETFLKAGIPIYIDKPIALSLEDLEKLYALERYRGQIFTCSALRYADELRLQEEDREHLGEIRQIIAYTPKSWDKYAVHIIEPVLNMLPEGDSPESFSKILGKSSAGASALCVNWKSGIQTCFFATGDGMTPISLRVLGTQGWKELNFTDAFSAFKKALETFVFGIRNCTTESPREFNSRVVQILEEGRA